MLQRFLRRIAGTTDGTQIMEPRGDAPARGTIFARELATTETPVRRSHFFRSHSSLMHLELDADDPDDGRLATADAITRQSVVQRHSRLQGPLLTAIS